MNLTLQLDASAYDAARLFALATNLGMYSRTAPQGAAASLEDIDSQSVRLDMVGIDPESLRSLRRMLMLGGSVAPPAIEALETKEDSRPLQGLLRQEIRELVSAGALGELSGDALFLLVRGVSSHDIYEVAEPVVDIWKRLLSKHAFPYRSEEQLVEELSTEGIELYERSDVDVELATTGYGGGEDGVAALVNGIAWQLERAGIAFGMRCWTG
jgi:hypothetical protein